MIKNGTLVACLIQCLFNQGLIASDKTGDANVPNELQVQIVCERLMNNEQSEVSPEFVRDYGQKLTWQLKNGAEASLASQGICNILVYIQGTEGGQWYIPKQDYGGGQKMKSMRKGMPLQGMKFTVSKSAKASDFI